MFFLYTVTPHPHLNRTHQEDSALELEPGLRTKAVSSNVETVRIPQGPSGLQLTKPHIGMSSSSLFLNNMLPKFLLQLYHCPPCWVKVFQGPPPRLTRTPKLKSTAYSNRPLQLSTENGWEGRVTEMDCYVHLPPPNSIYKFIHTYVHTCTSCIHPLLRSSKDKERWWEGRGAWGKQAQKSRADGMSHNHDRRE